MDLLRCPAQGRSCAQAVFVSHVQVTCLAFRVLGEIVIICGVWVNELMHPMVLLTLISRKLFSHFARCTIMKIDFVCHFFPPKMSRECGRRAITQTCQIF